jgi:hypothetical protein
MPSLTSSSVLSAQGSYSPAPVNVRRQAPWQQFYGSAPHQVRLQWRLAASELTPGFNSHKRERRWTEDDRDAMELAYDHITRYGYLPLISALPRKIVPFTIKRRRSGLAKPTIGRRSRV